MIFSSSDMRDSSSDTFLSASSKPNRNFEFSSESLTLSNQNFTLPTISLCLIFSSLDFVEEGNS